MTKFGGASARAFCGPAKASIHAGGKTFSIRGGACDKTSGWLAVNIGEVVIGQTAKTKPEYFGLAVGRGAVGSGPVASKDGVYHSAVVGFVHQGTGPALRGNATVTLSHGRTRGTFSATSLDGDTVTGSFSC